MLRVIVMRVRESNSRNQHDFTHAYWPRNQDPKKPKRNLPGQAAGLDQRPLTRREIVRLERASGLGFRV